MKIQKELDSVLETVILLGLGPDADKVREEYTHELDKVGINGKLFYEMYLDGYDEYLRSFIRNRIQTPDDISFSRDNSEYNDFIISIILLERNLIKNIDQMSKEALQHLIVATFNEIYEKEYLLSKTPATDELLAFVSQTDFTEGMKWQIMELLQDPQPFLKRLCAMIVNNLPAYEKTHKECQKYIERGLQYFMENIETRDFMGDVKQIVPMAVLPVSLISADSECYHGIYFKAISKSIISHEMDNEELSITLKAISDKSRLEILSLLRQAPMYSLEIAEKLELTAATVSHHMNTLIVRDLVTIEKRGGRVYYHLNHEALSTLIRQMERKLL